MTTPQAPAPELERSDEQAAPRQLRRSRRDHIVGGVCGGLGQYFGVDPIILRIAFVAMTLAGGSGVLLYVIAWIVIPEAGPEEDTPVAGAHPLTAPQAVVGAAMVLLGVSLLVAQFVPGIDQFFWPLLLVAVGAAVLLRGDQR